MDVLRQPIALRGVIRISVAVAILLEIFAITAIAGDRNAAPADGGRDLAFAFSFATLLLVVAIWAIVERGVIGPIGALERAVASLAGETSPKPLSGRFQLREFRHFAQAVDAVRDQLAAGKRSEQARRDTQRRNDELQAFAYIASHDLREPLRAITAFSELLAKRAEPNLDHKARGYLRHITNAAERMTDLIEGLAAYVRAGGDGPDQMEQATLQEAAEAAARKLAAGVKTAKAEIAIDTLPPIQTPRTPFTQVFENLFANALKFRHEDRACRIRVTATRERDAWRVTVADNGVGFGAEQADRAFQIFQRLHAGGRAGGQGVGLAIVQKVVSSIGGAVGVETAPGRGARFWFTVPDVCGPAMEVDDAAGS